MLPKLNLKGISIIVNELKDKILNNFISNISVINSSDILLTFSFYNKEKLLVSLNHNNPFISFVDASINEHTTIGNLNDNLRKYLKGSYITNIEQINSDRVIKFSLNKTNEFYQKDNYFLILELIPTINNLVILDEKENVVFAKHYLDLSAARPLLKGMKYESVEPNPNLVLKEFDYEEYKRNVNHYLSEINQKGKKEKALPLYNHLKQKVKSLSKKINVLTLEKEEATKKLEYKDIGQTILTLMNSDELNDYLETIKDTYDFSLSPNENANRYFDKYKKAKRTIENDDREIRIAQENIEELNHILNIFGYYSDEEIEELYKKYLPKHLHSNNKRKKEVDARLPYFITYKGIKIGFGKNKEQNNYLTFKKANRDDIYLHVASFSGAHVIIFDKDPSQEVILVASEIALILSSLESGDIYIADVKDVKKGDSLGQVNLLKYETITLHEVREETKTLLKDQKRLN